mgnify:CR=1 FL=1
MRIVVVLPQPDGPMSTQTSPVGNRQRQPIDRGTRRAGKLLGRASVISIMRARNACRRQRPLQPAEQAIGADATSSVAGNRADQRAAAAPSSRCPR